MSVDTTKVTGRRELHFESLQEILAEARRLAQGPVRHLGNLNFAQSLGHLAAWMNASIDGNIPMDPPLWFKLLARTFKGLLLKAQMRPGFKLSSAAQERFIPAPSLSVADGLAQLEAAVRRLETETARAESPMLGRLSAAEWNRLHCRHAELHLSFMKPEGGPA